MSSGVSRETFSSTYPASYASLPNHQFLGLGKQINEGGNGVFYECQFKTPSGIKTLAVKSTQKSENNFIREVKIVTSLNHPNLCPYLATAVDFTGTWAYMPLYISNLFTWCEVSDEMPKEKYDAMCLQFAMGLKSAVDYLLKKGVVHKDLNLMHTCIDESGNAIICAFDNVARIDPYDKSILLHLSAPGFASPDYCRLALGMVHSITKGEERRVDLWALAIILIILIKRRDTPFEECFPQRSLSLDLNKEDTSIVTNRIPTPYPLHQSERECLPQNAQDIVLIIEQLKEMLIGIRNQKDQIDNQHDFVFFQNNIRKMILKSSKDKKLSYHCTIIMTTALKIFRKTDSDVRSSAFQTGLLERLIIEYSRYLPSVEHMLAILGQANESSSAEHRQMHQLAREVLMRYQSAVLDFKNKTMLPSDVFNYN